MTPQLLALLPSNLDHLQAVLLHSLWQGLLASLTVFLVLRRTPVTRPNPRYGVAVSGLFGLVLAVLVTWCTLVYLDRPTTVPTAPGTFQSASAPSGPADSVAPLPGIPEAKTAPAPRAVLLPAQWLLAAWFAGVLVMLLRLCWLLRGARNLHMNALPVTDPAVCALLEELRAALRVSRRVAVCAVDGLASPVAMGLFWPVVILPLAMVTGLTAGQLRVVLAHELAHIRRYDYLVNFLQLVVEALLYFNPAVWWLSRQIRIEREACCDALAARLSGGAESYAVTLAEVARACYWGTSMPGVAQAFGEERHPGGLADRVRRLLLPGYWPRLRLRGHSILLGLLLSAALLLGLYQSSKLGVAFAGWCFTDAQRVEALNRVDKDLIPRPWNPDEVREQVRVSGRLVLPDGQMLPAKKVNLHCTSIARNCTTHAGECLKEDRFSFEIVVGEIFLCAEVPGYAPAWVGPLHGDAAHPIENAEIVLEPSVPATVRFLDPNGAVIPDVKVTGGYRYLPNSFSRSVSGCSDASGSVQFDQSLEKPVPLSLTAEASGFVRSTRDNLICVAGTSTDWVLQVDTPIAGVVVDKASGTPAEGAELALLFEEAVNRWVHGADGETVAATDAQGRFFLKGFDKTQSYCFLVRHAGHGSEVVRIGPPFDAPVRVELVSRYVRGIIRGDLNLLKRKRPEDFPGWTKGISPLFNRVISGGMNELGLGTGADIPIVSSSMSVTVGNMSHGDSATDSPVLIKDGVGCFQIDDLRAGDLIITAGPVTKRVQVKGPVEDLVIDLSATAKSPKRAVKLSFPVPSGAPAATGTVSVQGYYQHELPFINDKVSVKDGFAELNLDVPASLTIRVDGLTGYLPKAETDGKGAFFVEVAAKSCEIPAGTDPYLVETPLERAGAIKGVALLEDGSPASKASVYATVTAERGGHTFSGPLFLTSSECSPKGEFAFLPVPLSQTVEVKATLDCTTQTAMVKLSSWKPVAKVELRFGKRVDVPVLVLGPDNKPVPNMKVVLHGGSGHGETTDAEGRCVFRGADPAQKYTVTAQPTALYQPETMPLVVDGAEKVLRLKDGLHLAGEVRFVDSEAPAADIPLRAFLVSSASPIGAVGYDVETVTDKQGRFRFTNLCPGRFQVVLGFEPKERVDPVGYPDDWTFTAGQAEPAVIRVKSAGGKEAQ